MNGILAQGRTRRWLLLALALPITIWIASCKDTGSASEQSVRGIITAVEAQSLTNTERIVLRDAQGKTWEFRVAPEVEFTPGHLRQHMAFGEPVTVYYRRTPDGLVAYLITD
jgi:hypothetical protein